MFIKEKSDKLYRLKNAKNKRSAASFAAAAAVCFAAFALTTAHETVSESVRNALTVCGDTLIASMFPFMILSTFAVDYGVFESPPAFVSFLTKLLFNLPGGCFSAIAFGFVGGYPVGARTVSELYEKGKVTKSQAFRLFTFCINPGPAFVVSAVGGSILSSAEAGAVLLLSVCVSSLTVGVCGGIASRILSRKRPAAEDDASKKNTEYETDPARDFSSSLISSVAKSTQSIFSVCSWYIFFSVVYAVCGRYIKNAAVISLLGLFGEVTTASFSSPSIGGLPLCAFCISFGGLCVACQIAPYIKKCGIKIRSYLTFRLICAVLAYFTAKAATVIFKVNVAASSYVAAQPFSVNAPSCAALLLSAALLVYEVSSGRGKNAAAA